MSQSSKPVVSFLMLTVWLSMLLMGGCATPTFRAPPQFQTRVDRLKAAVLMPPKVQVYQLTAGGVTEDIEEWSTAARQYLTQALQTELATNAFFTVRPLSQETAPPADRPATTWTDLDDTQALYRAVSVSIILHTYVPEHTFRYKVEGFDYTLGPQVKTLAEQAQADALLFVEAVDYISTAGRQALTALGVLMGAATGVFVVPRGGGTEVRLALVDGVTGDLLWYNRHGAGSGYDLRNAESCQQLVQVLLQDFPGRQTSAPQQP